MSDFKPYPVLEDTVNLIKNTISDAKVDYTSESAATLKDGNDTIHLEHIFDSTENSATIVITDNKEIIYSEDLLSPLMDLPKKAKQPTTIIVNDLDVETYLIFQAVKDEFDQVSNSYELIRTTLKNVTKVKSRFKFGKHLFELMVVNEPTQVLVTPEFSSPIDAGIQKTIEGDVLKVQNAMSAAFKG